MDLSKMDFNDLGLGDMFGDLQEKAQKLQEENEAKIYTAKSGGGDVAIQINGNSEIIDIEINNELLDDKDSLQILLMSAVNDAIKMAEDGKKDMAMDMLGGMNPFGNMPNIGEMPPKV